MEELQRPCCIRGYHVYSAVWEAAIGEELACEREPHNARDRCAIAVSQNISCVYFFVVFGDYKNLSHQNFSIYDTYMDAHHSHICGRHDCVCVSTIKSVDKRSFGPLSLQLACRRPLEIWSVFAVAPPCPSWCRPLKGKYTATRVRVNNTVPMDVRSGLFD